MQAQVEMEIKLLVTPTKLEELLAAPLLKKLMLPQTSKKLQLKNVYYDTAELKLLQAGMAYRIRRTGRKLEATIKTTKLSTGGFSARKEYNVPLRKAEPVVEPFLKSDTEGILTPVLEGAELLPLFTINVERQICHLQLSAATVVELAIDKGTILAGEAAEPIAELEVELLQGSKADLFSFVAELAQLVPVQIEEKSKYQRGLELLGRAEKWRKKTASLPLTTEAYAGMQQLCLAYVGKVLTQQKCLMQQPQARQLQRLGKSLWKLEAYWKLVAPFMLVKDYEKGCSLLGSLLAPLNEALELEGLVGELRRVWGAQRKSHASYLEKQLEEDYKLAVTAVLQQISLGTYSAQLFQLLALSERQKASRVKFLQLGQLAAGRSLAWLQEAVAYKQKELKGESLFILNILLRNVVLNKKLVAPPLLSKDELKGLKQVAEQLEQLWTLNRQIASLRSLAKEAATKRLAQEASMLLGCAQLDYAKQERAWRKAWQNCRQSIKKEYKKSQKNNV